MPGLTAITGTSDTTWGPRTSYFMSEVARRCPRTGCRYTWARVPREVWGWQRRAAPREPWAEVILAVGLVRRWGAHGAVDGEGARRADVGGLCAAGGGARRDLGWLLVQGVPLRGRGQDLVGDEPFDQGGPGAGGAGACGAGVRRGCVRRLVSVRADGGVAAGQASQGVRGWAHRAPPLADHVFLRRQDASWARGRGKGARRCTAGDQAAGRRGRRELPGRHHRPEDLGFLPPQ